MFYRTSILITQYHYVWEGNDCLCSLAVPFHVFIHIDHHNTHASCLSGIKLWFCRQMMKGRSNWRDAFDPNNFFIFFLSFINVFNCFFSQFFCSESCFFSVYFCWSTAKSHWSGAFSWWRMVMCSTYLHNHAHLLRHNHKCCCCSLHTYRHIYDFT